MTIVIPDKYPEIARAQFSAIRSEIRHIATAHNLGKVEESLKWGEPSFSVKGGSPIRIDWKDKTPEVLNVYFHCQTRLIDTFKEVYPNSFTYQGNRALSLPLTKSIHDTPLKQCLLIAMTYHKVKHLPLLGAQPT